MYEFVGDWFIGEGFIIKSICNSFHNVFELNAGEF